MSISFEKKTNIFNLSTPSSTYLIGLLENKMLVHLFYGEKILSNVNFDDFFSYYDKAFSGKSTLTEKYYSEDVLPMEFPTFGSCDLRTPAFHAEYEDRSYVTKLIYMGHKIMKGKPKLKGLPSSYAENDNECDTLEIKLFDDLKKLTVYLYYTVFSKIDIITRSVEAVNNGNEKIIIRKINSMNVDFDNMDYDFMHLQGAWARERHIEKRPLMHGGQYIDSKRTSSSHQHNPFFALSSKNSDEYTGKVYGFSLVYSGNFKAGVEVDSNEMSRAFIGINDFNFCWELSENDEFYAPEAIMTFSNEGFNKMSQTFHDFVNNNIVRGKFKNKSRPVLINNWEATYFDFNEEKIVDIAKSAKELGVELMVLDDGWFGKRNLEDCSLGDWYPDRNKLPNGIKGLAEKVNALGMKFGLWFEPEMISPDSDLYRKHSDWAIHTNNRKSSLGRHQLVLDLSKEEVCSYIIDFMSDILEKNPISYVKWDMNRNITEYGDNTNSKLKQDVSHKYIIGLYRVLETLMNKFPDVLFEGCSGGGGRFDLGMFCYFPQFWTSDDTDAAERMFIQYGTSLVYPTSVMGAHVSAVPNHQVGRTTPIETRGNVAFCGRLGYELDLGKLTGEEKQCVKEQIVFYKKYEEIIHNGKMYRLQSPFETDDFALEFVNEDDIVVIYATVLGKPNPVIRKLRLKGLEPEKQYKEIVTNKIYGGDFLQNVGIVIENYNDFESGNFVFKKL